MIISVWRKVCLCRFFVRRTEHKAKKRGRDKAIWNRRVRVFTIMFWKDLYRFVVMESIFALLLSFPLFFLVLLNL